MKDNPKCATCEYFEPDAQIMGGNIKGGIAGFCKYNPPVTTIKQQAGQGMGISTTFPVVNGTQWCGRHPNRPENKRLILGGPPQ